MSQSSDADKYEFEPGEIDLLIAKLRKLMQHPDYRDANTIKDIEWTIKNLEAIREHEIRRLRGDR